MIRVKLSYKSTHYHADGFVPGTAPGTVTGLIGSYVLATNIQNPKTKKTTIIEKRKHLN